MLQKKKFVMLETGNVQTAFFKNTEHNLFFPTIFPLEFGTVSDSVVFFVFHFLQNLHET